jgi:hypothetical protein
VDDAEARQSDMVAVTLWFVVSLVSDGLALIWAATTMRPILATVGLGVLGLSAYLLAAWVILRVARISVGLPGAHLVFAAFVLHAISRPLTVVSVLLAFGPWRSAQWPYIVLFCFLAAVFLLGLAASPASGVCLWLGLRKTRLVPSWAAWFALVSAALTVAYLVFSFLEAPRLSATLVHGNGLQVVQTLQRWTGGFAALAELLFVAALGLTLFWRQLHARRADGPVVVTPDT